MRKVEESQEKKLRLICLASFADQGYLTAAHGGWGVEAAPRR